MTETMPSSRAKKLLTRFVIVSAIVHMGFSFVYLDGIKFFEYKESPKEETRISLRLVPANKAKQIVQTVESNNKKSDQAKFLSKSNNSYDRETKTQNIGKFALANKGVRDGQNKKRQKTKKEELTKKLKRIKFSDLAIKHHEKLAVKQKKKKQHQTAAKRLGLKSGKRTGKALGASNDFLEDIPLGDFTKLNTQEYEFYGFYHRIREKLEQFWGNNIQTEAEKIFKQGRSIASESNLITGLTIKINAKGEIVDIALKSTSGIKELDDAAVKSFNQAGPFPNPPKGMIKGDGKAVIEWGFVVNT